MGMWMSSLPAEDPPPDIAMVSDSLYEVHAPDKGEPDMAIIFFHGLEMSESRKAHWKTWMSETDTGNVFWPKEWLAQKFPRARIVLVSYDASAVKSKSAGSLDLYLTGECLVHALGHLDYGSHGKPIILVSHSLGGLVMKEMVLQASRQTLARTHDGYHQRRLRNFLNQLKGLFYFSTPHYGPQLVNLAAGMLTGRQALSALMRAVTGADVDRLNEAFRIWRKNTKDGVQAFTVGETQLTITRKGSFGTQRNLVVPEASARYDTDGFMSISADHFQVSKPKSPASSSFRALTRFISAVTGVPPKTFDIDSHNMTTGMPVEMPQRVDDARNHPRPSDLEPAEGIPVKSMRRDTSVPETYVRIDVPEDREAFIQQYETQWQDDLVRNYHGDP